MWCYGPVGYVQVMPVVYCGLFPTDAEQFEPLREALGRLQLNDAALQFEPEVRTHKHYFALRAFSSVSQHVLVCPQRMAAHLQSQFGPSLGTLTMLHINLCCLP